MPTKATSPIKAQEVSFEKLQELDCVPANQAAEILKLHRSGVWRYMQSGVLSAYRHANRLYVSRPELKKLKKLRDKEAFSTGDGARGQWKQTKRGTLPRNAK